MKYLLLAYGNRSEGESLPAGERDAFERDCRAHDEALRESGYLLTSQHLPGDSPVITLRVLDGAVTLSDGPLAEIQEQLAAVITINARDLNEAVRVASQMPQARRGPIEVRSM